MTLEELAIFLKVSETTAYQLVHSGRIPGRKVGREWRVLKTRIISWLMQTESGDDMNDSTGQDVVQLDSNGAEFKVQNGQEFVALWLPMTREEKARQLDKAARDGVNVSEMVAAHLRDWASN